MSYNIMLTWYIEGEKNRTKYKGTLDEGKIEDKVQLGKRVEDVIKEGMGVLGIPEFMYKYVNGTVDLLVSVIQSDTLTAEWRHLCSIASNDSGIFQALDFYISRTG